MKPWHWVVIIVALGGFAYWRHVQSLKAQASPTDPAIGSRYSINNGIGTIFNTWTQDPITGQVAFPYARATGSVETYTSNPLMTTYQNYLLSGNQGVPFETYLTQAQSMGLPMQTSPTSGNT